MNRTKVKKSPFEGFTFGNPSPAFGSPSPAFTFEGKSEAAFGADFAIDPSLFSFGSSGGFSFDRSGFSSPPAHVTDFSFFQEEEGGSDDAKMDQSVEDKKKDSLGEEVKELKDITTYCPIGSDLLVIVEPWRFHVNHKTISESSPYFKTLVQNKKQMTLDSDVLPKIFEEFLKWVYAPPWSPYTPDQKYFRELVVMCHKCSVTALKDICEKGLISQITHDNVAEMLSIAQDNDLKILLGKCMKKIANLNIKKRDLAFLNNLSKKNLFSVVKSLYLKREEGRCNYDTLASAMRINEKFQSFSSGCETVISDALRDSKTKFMALKKKV
jgi:hypothetical protein